MKDVEFLTHAQIVSLHEEQIRLFGGMSGIADQGMLESATISAQYLYLYDDASDIFDLAACYTFHIGKNHPFHDGNKRCALQAALTFLEINGIEIDFRKNYEPPLRVTDEVLTDMVLAAMENRVTQKDFADVLFCLVGPHLIQPCADLARAHAGSLIRERSFKSNEEAKAFIIDALTSKIQAEEIELCQRLHIRPDRIYNMSSVAKQNLFEKVSSEWRQVFGIAATKSNIK